MSQDILCVFDYDREGFRHIGESISLYLDYQALVSLKRTCRTLYHFFQNSPIEERVFKRKLHRDWMVGTPTPVRLPFFSSNLNAPVTTVKTVRDSEILFSTGKKVYQFDFRELQAVEENSAIGPPSP